MAQLNHVANPCASLGGLLRIKPDDSQLFQMAGVRAHHSACRYFGVTDGAVHFKDS
jgi:hypothetical protein